jgi:Na+/proline symporter
MVDPLTALVVVAAALALFAFVGLRTRLRGESVEDYLVARNSQRFPRTTPGFGVSTLGCSARCSFT